MSINMMGTQHAKFLDFERGYFFTLQQICRNGLFTFEVFGFINFLLYFLCIYITSMKINICLMATPDHFCKINGSWTRPERLNLDQIVGSLQGGPSST